MTPVRGRRPYQRRPGGTSFPVQLTQSYPGGAAPAGSHSPSSSIGPYSAWSAPVASAQ
ncbi:hypothetical protein BX264_2078 [Streptomyces sp. 2333.5]|nr:hypothetical protein BX264_2078 [Streptomyces sp. 2333.5]SEC79158.1 hypothetical protein SAMN05428943_2222 [Streptomyces sp. 2314.4]SED59087.1 hypothetical protein SAMN05428942_2092 [Streptomyces sp. 2112.2]